MGIQERKEREKEQRRNDIIDAAERVFMKKGFDHTTVDDVAAEAELSKGTVYLYFKSKDELHFAINMRGMYKLKEIITAVYDNNKGVIENLEEIGRVFIRFSEEEHIYFKAILHFESKCLEDMGDEAANLILTDTSPIPFLVHLIDKGKENGEIRADMNSLLLVKLLWSQIMGVLQFVFYKQKLIETFQLNTEQIFQGLFEILKNGVRETIKK